MGKDEQKAEESWESKRKRLRSTPMPRSPFVSPARKAGDIAGRILEKAMAERGFATLDILSNWEAIVGPGLAEVTAPDRLAWPRAEQPDEETPPSRQSRPRRQGATLHIRVEGPIAIEVQHLSPQIIARINQFFGYAAVGAIRILQAPVAGRGKSRAATPAGPIRRRQARPAEENEPVEGIEDAALAAALARLKQGITGS
jgi:hypothetical protein